MTSGPGRPFLDPVAAAWHDLTCPEAQECRDRHLHALSDPLVTTGLLRRFLGKVGLLERQQGSQRLHEPYDRAPSPAPPSR